MLEPEKVVKVLEGLNAYLVDTSISLCKVCSKWVRKQVIIMSTRDDIARPSVKTHYFENEIVRIGAPNTCTPTKLTSNFALNAAKFFIRILRCWSGFILV